MKQKLLVILSILAVLFVVVLLQSRSVSSQSFFRARDPGVRGGVAGAGVPIRGLTPNQRAFFEAGKEDFEEAEEVAESLGPTMNLDGCAGCHMQPASVARAPS